MCLHVLRVIMIYDFITTDSAYIGSAKNFRYLAISITLIVAVINNHVMPAQYFQDLEKKFPFHYHFYMLQSLIHLSIQRCM